MGSNIFGLVVVLINEKKASVKAKIAGILFVAFIITISVLIYLYRDLFRNLGSLGYLGVLLICFVCNATVLAPAPSLAVVISAALSLNPMLAAFAGAVGTTLGETVGYAAGYMGKKIIDIESNKMAGWVKKYGAPVIFIFALLPLPLFDIVGLASGYLRIKFLKFFLSCFFGKFIKMSVYALGAGYFEKIILQGGS
ncbi:MAG: VTT domain-containing protein [Treponema sp.]|jgi:membrane protein YqaA with SNARE-associated domain|nr:VTT domain-containing protein [Treponema sp.]